MNVREALPTAAEWQARHNTPDTYDPARDRDALTAYGPPKVPGINAQPLQPSIGTDQHRLTRNGKQTSQMKHKARPMSGTVDLTKVPPRRRPRKADPDRFAPMKAKGHRERSKGPRKIGTSYND